MKRIIFLFAFIVVAVSLFASDYDHPIIVAKSSSNINSAAINSFAKVFKDAKAVSWEATKDLYLAYFLLNNEQLTAVYDQTGEYISTSRSIEFAGLPLSVSMSLKNKYKSFLRVGRVTEVSYSNYSVYYFTIASGKNYLRIRSTSEGDLSVSEKMRNLNTQ